MTRPRWCAPLCARAALSNHAHLALCPLGYLGPLAVHAHDPRTPRINARDASAAITQRLPPMDAYGRTPSLAPEGALDAGDLRRHSTEGSESCGSRCSSSFSPHARQGGAGSGELTGAGTASAPARVDSKQRRMLERSREAQRRYRLRQRSKLQVFPPPAPLSLPHALSFPALPHRCWVMQCDSLMMRR